MKIALISDIHGNLEALEAVFADIDGQGVDDVCCLGDVVGYGSDPAACLTLVIERCTVTLMGNHEYAVLGLVDAEEMNDAAQRSLAWTAENLSDKERSLITDLPLTHEIEDALLVHASPHDPVDWHYVLTRSEAARAFEDLQQRLCFFGHTHVPMIFSQSDDGSIRSRMGHDFDPDEDARYLVNVGSVGQPRDDDPRAGYVIYDSTELAISYHRVEYDIQKTQAKMSEHKLPKMLIERLEFGR
ncbi:metallophosphoesterase [candidate division GN15 bacterium]|nr:metallophosphoesterase [candidate division GN15 bacterium]